MTAPTDAPTPSGAMLVWEPTGPDDIGDRKATTPFFGMYRLYEREWDGRWYAYLLGLAGSLLIDAGSDAAYLDEAAARAACEADCRERMRAAGWVPAAEAERWKRVSGEWMKGFADAKLALRDLVDRAPQLGAPTPEPNLRAIVEGYYRLHGIGNWQELASRYLAEIATPAPPA